MHYSLYALAAVVAIVLYLSLIPYQRRRKAQQLGCVEAPLVDFGFLGYNNIKNMMRSADDRTFPEALVKRHFAVAQQEGRELMTWRYSLLGPQNIHTSDPKNMQAMLTTQFDDFSQGRMKRAIFEPLLGPGIFSQDGKAWEHSRAMLRPSFSRDQVGDLQRLEVHVQNLMRAIKTSDDPIGWSEDVDLRSLFFRLTIDSSTEMLFGKSVNSQLLALPDYRRPEGFKTSALDEAAFTESFDLGTDYASFRAKLGKFSPYYITKDAKRCEKVVQNFVEHYVQEALDSTYGEKADDIESRYVFAEAIAKETRDPKVITAQLLNILLAGRDTTAALLAYVFRQLIRHPKIHANLRREVINTFGTYSNPTNITFASLKSCHALQNVLNETLRLNTIVPLNQRTATRDTTLPHGGGSDGTKPILVLKGQTVDFSTHVMHRRKELWGPDADEFKPERFEGRRFGWEFLPFHGGPRICIGQQMAIVTASYVIVRLLQRYGDIEGTEEEMAATLGDRVGITSTPDRGPVVRMREAEA